MTPTITAFERSPDRGKGLALSDVALTNDIPAASQCPTRTPYPPVERYRCGVFGSGC
jgi:hypothetical protein